jgi:DNA polymerase
LKLRDLSWAETLDREVLWASIRAEITTCRRCELHKSRTKAVPGEGNLYSKVMFLGEAPGRSEDEEGRPFVGAAGRLLTKLVESIGLRREEVFITNVVKCRPPGNREPRFEEMSACSYFTDAIVSLVNPSLIVTLGNYAGYYVFEMKGGVRWLGISRMRGRLYRLKVLGQERAVIPTYHPAAALYNPQTLAMLQNDFTLIKEYVHCSEGRGVGLLKFLHGGNP